MERMECFFNGGVLNNIKPEDLTWDGYKLFIEESPEPNDIDWEFIHIPTRKKIKHRLIAHLLSYVFMLGCFIMIWVVTRVQGILLDKAVIEAFKGQVDESSFFWI